MVTYVIPFVAIFWGWLSGETISWLHWLSLAIILSGVFLASGRLSRVVSGTASEPA
jgi:drug/metabolite transporter (DMT)-like permease